MSHFPESFSLLNAASGANTTGSPVKVAGASTYSLQVKHSGGPTVVITLEGSNNDGRDWDAITTWDSSTATNGDIVFVVDKPVQMIRAKITTWSGGTNPTVSAWGAAA